MKNKKWLLLLIIAFPSLFWLILESSTIHSHRLNYYGPKKVEANGDSLFYQINNHFNIRKDSLVVFNIDTIKYPVFVVQFMDESFKNEDYRFLGFNEYFTYKYEKIKEVPVFIIGKSNTGIPESQQVFQKFTQYANLNFLVMDSINFYQKNAEFFAGKPYYVDNGYIALIDANRNIRGYYDGRFASEIKRLIDEFTHLRLKEEKIKLIESNEIKTNP
ncbi:MAG: hypothetical protein IPM51_12905 [Sphingobacteriaceae bacterium]|nr:hypothetical protein [Sphingobacteriaceae bacterium]